MIGAKYQQEKQQIQNLIEKFRVLCKEPPESINKSGFQDLESRLENDTFKLFIVGEAKAGKSTLINALIGHEILPTNALQCSSAIIEICCSKSPEDYFLEIGYADKHVERKTFNPSNDNMDEIGTFLYKAAAVQEKYRSIPTNRIDDYIVKKKGVGYDWSTWSTKNNRPTKDVMKQWFDDANLTFNNETEQLTQKYLKERSPAQIPSLITIGVWFGENAFTGFRIVDSPGVGAIGGFDTITINQINEGNAYLFAHPLSNQIESKSFSTFVNEYVTKRKKEDVFLVLTKRGKEDSYDDITNKFKEAKKIFGHNIKADNFFNVDSVAKLVLHDLQKEQDAKTLLEKYNGKLANYQAEGSDKNVEGKKSLLLSKRRILEDITLRHPQITVAEAEEKVTEIANFDKLEEVIGNLITNSFKKIICDILEVLNRNYSQEIAKINNKIMLIKDGEEDSEIFAEKIKKQQDQLAEYQNRMVHFVEEFQQKKSGKSRQYGKSKTEVILADKFRSAENNLKKIKNEDLYSELLTENLDEYLNKTDNTYAKFLIEYHDDILSYIEKVHHDFKQTFETEQKKLKLAVEKTNEVFLPEIDITSHFIDAQINAYDTANVSRKSESWWESVKSFFGAEYTRFDSDKYHCAMEINLTTEMSKLWTKVRDSNIKLIDRLLDRFTASMVDEIERQKRTLKDLKSSFNSLEDVNKELTKLETTANKFANELHCVRIEKKKLQC
ncbi:MAG: dynamin family protein [Aestuariivita sp.]|nr:dynamin family protein [Aestuariivita sp.]